jgi:hypothetical protein
VDTENRNNRNEPKHGIRSRKQIQVFLVCLAISTFTWFLIKLSKEYYYESAFKVIYTHVPAGKIISNHVDSALILTIRSSGYNTLYRKVFGYKQNLVIDLGDLKVKKNGNVFDANLPTTELTDLIQNQLNPQEKLTDISPHNILFRFEKAYSKKIPVRLNLEVTYHKQYNLYDKIYIYPDSLTVTGPLKSVQAIKEIGTKPQILNDVFVSQFFIMPVAKDFSSGCLSLSKDYVKVIIPVAQYTEASVEVPVQIDSVPGNFAVKSYPEKVKIVYQVALCDYNKVKPEMFLARINAKNTLTENIRKIKVDLVHFPSFIRIIKTQPDRVEYIIIK